MSGPLVVVVTGASSGIGRETARRFAAETASVVLAARNEEALRVVAEEVSDLGGTPLVLRTDVADRGQVDALADAALARFGRIDVWVNNAGVSAFGELAELPLQVIERMLQVDLLGQIYGVKAALPIMRRQGHGTIIGVASLLGVRSAPLQVPYCVSKAGVVALYEGLRMEERRARSGVQMTTILPAAIDTPFYDVAASWMGVRPAAIPPVYQPSAVAEAVLFAAHHPRRQIAVGGAGAALAALQRISPTLTDKLLAVDDQIFKRQRRAEPDHGESNLWEPIAGTGAVRGTSVSTALPRSRWSRTVGYHPAIARAALGVAAVLGAVAYRQLRRSARAPTISRSPASVTGLDPRRPIARWATPGTRPSRRAGPIRRFVRRHSRLPISSTATRRAAVAISDASAIARGGRRVSRARERGRDR